MALVRWIPPKSAEIRKNGAAAATLLGRPLLVEVEAIPARETPPPQPKYTPLTPEEFREGELPLKWNWEDVLQIGSLKPVAYSTVGEGAEERLLGTPGRNLLQIFLTREEEEKQDDAVAEAEALLAPKREEAARERRELLELFEPAPEETPGDQIRRTLAESFSPEKINRLIAALPADARQRIASEFDERPVRRLTTTTRRKTK